MSNPTTNPKNAPTVDTSHPLGQRLKQAREKKNLSLEDVASQTNILKRHLVALEEGDYESLPQPTFARGFAVNYGRFLGIDSQVINQVLMLNTLLIYAKNMKILNKMPHYSRWVRYKETVMAV